MRNSLQALMKKIKGKNVFILGGGDTVRTHVDFSLLQNELVICTNDAYKDFPNATAIYWVDENWASDNFDALIDHSCELIFTSKPERYVSYDRKDDPTTICGTYMLKRTSDFGYDTNPDCVCGNNSGTQIINLVANMKPKTIILLGFDMKRIDGRTHYHNAPRPPIKDDVYTDLFIPSTIALAKGIQDSDNNVQIINASPNSALTCFEFGEYTDYLSNK